MWTHIELFNSDTHSSKSEALPALNAYLTLISYLVGHLLACLVPQNGSSLLHRQEQGPSWTSRPPQDLHLRRPYPGKFEPSNIRTSNLVFDDMQ